MTTSPVTTIKGNTTMQVVKLIPITLLAIGAPLASAMANGVGGYGHMSGWGGMIIGPFMMIFFVAILVAVVVLVLRALGVGGVGGKSSDGQSALAILEERFARGEIDHEEFEARRRTLTK